MKRTEKGFTLIELLVVIAIIGILAAIAIPQFSSYRARGFDARARSDLRNGATAQESVFAASEEYVACTEANCEALLPGFRLSQGVDIEYELVGTTAFTGTSSHENGTQNLVCSWDSAAGGDTGCEAPVGP